LYGDRKSIVDGRKFQRYSDTKKKKQIALHYETDTTQIELRRLRKDAAMKNIFPFLEDLPKPSSQEWFVQNPTIKICFHNVANLSYHLDYIKADFGMMNADVLLFAECHSKPTQKAQMAIPGYKLIHLSGSNEINASNGLACYMKNGRGVNFIKDNSTNGLYSSSSGVELALLTVNLANRQKIFVCSLYNHPKNSFQSFWDEFKTFIIDNIPHIRDKSKAPIIFVFGDFNFNLLQRKSISDENLGKFLNKFHLKLTNIDRCTTDRETLIDWCLTNANSNLRLKAFVYESFFSDHKPLWLYIDNL
jgi:exonuclease III